MKRDNHTDADLKLVRMLRALPAFDQEEVPAQPSQRTPECPSLPRFAEALRAEDWTDTESKHVFESGCIYCGKVLAMFDRASAEPVGVAPPPSPAPDPGGTGYTTIAAGGDIDALRAELLPWLPFLFRHLGLERFRAGELAAPFFDFIRPRLREVGHQPGRRFRDLLPGWLRDFGAANGLTLVVPLSTEDWEAALRAAADHEAAYWSLTQAPADEPDLARAIRSEAKAHNPQSPRFLREFRSKAEQEGNETATRIRRRLAAESEQRQMARYEALELSHN